MQSVLSGEEKEPPPPQRGWVRSFAPPRNCAREARHFQNETSCGGNQLYSCSQAAPGPRHTRDVGPPWADGWEEKGGNEGLSHGQARPAGSAAPRPAPHGGTAAPGGGERPLRCACKAVFCPKTGEIKAWFILSSARNGKWIFHPRFYFIFRC